MWNVEHRGRTCTIDRGTHVRQTLVCQAAATAERVKAPLRRSLFSLFIPSAVSFIFILGSMFDC